MLPSHLTPWSRGLLEKLTVSQLFETFFSFLDHSPSFSYPKEPVIRPSHEPNKPRTNKSDYSSYCKMLSRREMFSHEFFLSILLHRDVSTFSSVHTKLLSLKSIPNLSFKFCFSFNVVFE